VEANDSGCRISTVVPIKMTPMAKRDVASG
jgi:hypothetical protein